MSTEPLLLPRQSGFKVGGQLALMTKVEGTQVAVETADWHQRGIGLTTDGR